MSDSAGPVKVMLVESDPGVLRGLESALVGLPVRVSSASRGEAALATLPGFAPDIVLSGFQLAGMDGQAFLALVQRRHPRAFCVLYADGLVPPRFDCDFPVLAKPCAPDAVRYLVAGLISEVRVRDASRGDRI